MIRRLSVALAIAYLVGCAASTPPTGAQVGAQHTVSLGDNQKPLWLVAAGGWLYCSCPGAGGITLLDTETAHDLHPMPLSSGAPGYTRTFLDRRQVLVSDPIAGSLYVIDADAAAPSPAPHLLQHVDTGTGEARVAIMEDNNTMAATAANADRVYVLKFADDRSQAPSRVSFPVGAPAPDGRARPVDLKDRLVLVPNFATGDVETIQLGTSKVTTLTNVKDVSGVALGTRNGTATTAIILDHGNNAIVLVDLATNKVTTLTDVGKGPSSVDLSPETQRAFVSMADSNEVAVVDYGQKSVVTRIPVGKHPTWVQPAPPVPGEFWIANDDSTVSVIDGAADMPSLRATVNVGAGPHRITFWGNNGYVTNQADGTLSIVDRITFR